MSRGVLLAVVLVALAEGAARVAVATGRLDRDASATVLIDGHVDRLARRDADVWLLGNSTLYYGVDAAELERLTGRSTVMLEHGSATVRASAAMLEFYLRRAPHKPRTVVLFVSKDDLNVNGYRASISAAYLDRAAGRGFAVRDHLYLCAAKDHIRGKFVNAFERLKATLTRKRASRAPATAPAVVTFDGKDLPRGESWYTGLLRDFAYDGGAVEAFVAAAKASGVSDLTVVAVPTTDVYARFHDASVASPKFDLIRSMLRQTCDGARVRLLDFSEPSADYARFRDPYHLNEQSKVWFTGELGKVIGLGAETAR